jgi:hypothetical protein
LRRLWPRQGGSAAEQPALAALGAGAVQPQQPLPPYEPSVRALRRNAATPLRRGATHACPAPPPALADARYAPPQRGAGPEPTPPEMHAAAASRSLAQAAASAPAAGPVASTEASLSDEQQRSMSFLLADHMVSGSSWRGADDRTAHRLNHDTLKG